MYISNIRIKDYKSFKDSGEINFKHGMNVIIGTNNSGKSALLKALSLRFENKPHISEARKPKRDTDVSNRKSIVEITINVSFDEMNEFTDISTIILPQPKHGNIDRALREFNNLLIKSLNLKFSITEKGVNKGSLWHGLYEEKDYGKEDSLMRLYRNEHGQYIIREHSDYQRVGGDIERTLGWQLISHFTKHIYQFEPERTNLGRSALGDSQYLHPNASNLAEVLQNTLTRRKNTYKIFNELLTEVLPSVRWVTSITTRHPQTSNTLVNEVRVWNAEKTDRDDLAIPLSECGTGVGQVLAILYILVTSNDEPQTIIIDEPNSYLHPKAAKKLIEILNRFPQHQYFISTHSPEILSAAKPSTITGLQYIDGETVAKSISLEQTKDLREVLDEVGVRFSDVFFADEILWVEGPTEEKAFPIILESESVLSSVTILPLAHTGDFKSKKQNKKNARLVFDIYKKLTGAHALTPPVVGVILDKDETDQNEMDELKRLSDGLLEFLPRRLFENYLLDAEAITHILNQEIEQEDKKVSIKAIEEWIEKKREAKEFLAENFLRRKKEIKQIEWIENVDGAKLLEKLFSDLSNKKVEYRKTTHSINLTRWLVDNKPEQFAELKKFLLEILKSNSQA